MITIEIIYKNKKYQIDFIVSKPMEFIQSMYMIGNEDYFVNLGKELNFEGDQSIMDHIDSRKKLSKFSQQELSYFFGYKSLFGLTCFIIFMVKNLEIETVEEMIDVIEKSEINTFIRNLVWGTIKRYLDENDTVKKDYSDITIEEMLSKINNINDNEIELKEKITEILENPFEAKQRLCHLLKQFYEKVYRPIEDETIHMLQSHRDKYQRIFSENPQLFFKQYLKIDLDSTETSKIVLHISHWLQVGSSFTYSYDLLFIAIGLHIDKFYGKKAIRERLQKFFKVLSDKKRIDIIDTLGERPYYVHEIAEKLDLTSATVSYHLSFLFELDLVENVREDHRIYYSLKKERAKELFEEAMSALLHE